MEINNLLNALTDEEILEGSLSSSIQEPLERIRNLRDACLNFHSKEESLEIQEAALKNLAQKVVKELDIKEKDCQGKFGNLNKMGAVINRLGLEKLNIPVPVEVTSDSLHDFWRSKNVSILTDWKKLDALFQERDKSSNFLENKEVIEILRKIEKSIQEVFEDIESVPLPDDWIQAHEESFLMVRSNGAEDSKESANAGGNASIAYVKAEREAICKAVSEVVQSYFGMNSLQNRINAGLNPFEGEVKLSVILQELIGEPVGGETNPDKIPISFVLFTNEPLFIGGEKFRVMQMAATYGHGEAVVGSQGIGTDSILFIHSEKDPSQLYTIYSNEKKLERLAPISKNPTILEKIKNPDELIHKKAFSETDLLEIYRGALLVEGIYDGNATDIEGVLKNGVVHFVQARPVNRQEILPTYLNSLEASLKSMKMTSVVSADASVIRIEKESEVLIASTLEEAEHQFLTSNPPKLIIVKEIPSATSHPVVNFRGLNIPCLATSEMKELKELFSQIETQKPIAVCMQTASLHLWNETIQKIETATQSGFGAHPATIAHSMEIDPEVLFPENKEKDVFLEKLFATSNWTSIEERIQNFETEVQALKQTSESHHTSISKRIEALETLLRALKSSLEEVKAIKSSMPRLKVLFHKKVLESLLFGKITNPNLLGSGNLLRGELLIEETKSLIDYQNSLVQTPKFIDLLSLGSFDPSGWKTFLLNIEKENPTKEQIELFKEWIFLLQKSDSLAFWFTFLSGEKTFEEILNEATIQEKEFLKSLTNDLDKIKNLYTQVDKLADPSTFEEGLNTLNSWAAKLTSNQTTSEVGKIALYKAIFTMVDVFDLSIKEMKASQNFESSIKKVELFKRMLEGYLTLMKGILPLLSFNSRQMLNPRGMDLEQYSRVIQSILQNINTRDVDQLRPSSNFSVSAAMLGASTNFYRHQPETLEDIFTLIHQSSLAMLQMQTLDTLPPNHLETSSLPTSLRKAMNELENGAHLFRIQRIGMEFKDDEIVVYYNVPLRNHSGKVELHFDKKMQSLSMYSQFLGEARTRWSEIATWGRILDKAGFLKLKEPAFEGPQELSFTWNLADETDLQTALEEYNFMADWTLSGGGWWGANIPYLTNLRDRWINKNKAIEIGLGSLGESPDITQVILGHAWPRPLKDAFDSIHSLAPLSEKNIQYNGSSLLISLGDPSETPIEVEIDVASQKKILTYDDLQTEILFSPENGKFRIKKEIPHSFDVMNISVHTAIRFDREFSTIDEMKQALKTLKEEQDLFGQNPSIVTFYKHRASQWLSPYKDTLETLTYENLKRISSALNKTKIAISSTAQSTQENTIQSMKALSLKLFEARKLIEKSKETALNVLSKKLNVLFHLNVNRIGFLQIQALQKI